MNETSMAGGVSMAGYDYTVVEASLLCEVACVFLSLCLLPKSTLNAVNFVLVIFYCYARFILQYMHHCQTHHFDGMCVIIQ